MKPKTLCTALALTMLAATASLAADSTPASGATPAGTPGSSTGAAPLVSSAPASPESAVPRFTINRFFVRNNTILSGSELAALFAPHEGPDKDFGDVQRALDALENAYRLKGYNSVSVYLPEQELKDGAVIFSAVEARISRIDVEGNRYFTRENIEDSFPTIKKGEFPLIHEISKNLRAVNENPAKKINLQLQGGEQDDEVIAKLKVTDEKHWKAGLTVDNTGTSQTGEYRVGILLQHFNLHNKDHVASFQYSTSPDHADSVKSVSASYRLPLYSFGDTLDVFAGYSDVDSPLAVSGYDLKTNGKGVLSGVRYNLTLKRFAEYSQKLVLGFDYRLYDNNLSTQGSSENLLKNGRQALHPLSLTYNGSYTMEQGEASFNFGGAYNIPWGPHGEKGDFPEGTAADYFVLRYGASLAQALPADFQLRLSFNGQYSPRNLVSYEQFGLGGASVGRGYLERAAAGDIGYSGSAEIYSPDIARLSSWGDTQLRLLAFYDDGYARKADAIDGDDGGIRLASIGGGVRLSISKYFTASTDWGVTLNSVGTTPAGDNRIHFKAAIIY